MAEDHDQTGAAAQPAFLTTKEVADLLRVRERKVYDMAAAGEIPCHRVTGKLLFPRDEISAWIRGSGAPRAPSPEPPRVVAGSHDPLLDWAIRASGSGLATLFDGSLDGLDRVAGGEALAAGLHLFEPREGAPDWNRAHVAERLGDRPIVLVEWARRATGLILAPGLGARVADLEDLDGLRVVRRQSGAGAARLFEHLLAEAQIAPDTLGWTEETARTETDAAAAVASGRADAAPGLASMARAFGLDFHATMTERYDLAVDRRAWFEPPFQRLLAFARSRALAEQAETLGGYDLSGLGTVQWNAP